MSNDVKLKMRIKNKHDIPANWAKATFVPMAGEIVVYDDHYFDDEGNKVVVADAVRFKIGDGVTPINDLPFVEAVPDWEQTDANKAGYIKNKPFYEENVVIPARTLTFDGNLDGKTYIDCEDFYLVRLTEEIIPIEALQGQAMTVYEAGSENETILSIAEDHPEWGYWDDETYTVTGVYDAEKIPDSHIMIPNGIWVVCIPGERYVSKINIAETSKLVLKQLDKKFIPTTFVEDLAMSLDTMLIFDGGDVGGMLEAITVLAALDTTILE